MYKSFILVVFLTTSVTYSMASSHLENEHWKTFEDVLTAIRSDPNLPQNVDLYIERLETINTQRSTAQTQELLGDLYKEKGDINSLQKAYSCYCQAEVAFNSIVSPSPSLDLILAKLEDTKKMLS
jgi:hypothetical protein